MILTVPFAASGSFLSLANVLLQTFFTTACKYVCKDVMYGCDYFFNEFLGGFLSNIRRARRFKDARLFCLTAARRRPEGKRSNMSITLFFQPCRSVLSPLPRHVSEPESNQGQYVALATSSVLSSPRSGSSCLCREKTTLIIGKQSTSKLAMMRRR